MKLFVLYEDKNKSAIAAVFNDDQQWLLGLSNADDDRNNKWVFPGGRVKENESVLQAAARECSEETGIKSNPIKKLKNIGDAVVCLCHATDDKPLCPNHEFDDLKWYSVDQVKESDNILSSNKNIILELSC